MDVQTRMRGQGLVVNDLDRATIDAATPVGSTSGDRYPDMSTVNA